MIWDRIATLPLVIDGYALERLEFSVRDLLDGIAGILASAKEL